MIKAPDGVTSDRLKIATISKGTHFYRISHSQYATPLYFNRDQSSRYNSPDGEYGVCYVADTFEVAFSESLGHSVALKYQPSQKKVMAIDDLIAFHVYEFYVNITLHVGELCGSGLPKLNLDNAINTSPKPYSIPQQWSAWVYQHSDKLDGLR